MRFEVTIATRTNHGECVAATRHFDLHFLDRLLQRFSVVEGADTDARERAQRVRVEVRNGRREIDIGDAVLLAFFDLEGDQEALLTRIVFGQSGNHLHVGKAVLQVIAADQIAIGFDAVRIIDIARTEEREEVRLAGLDDVLQTIGRVIVVADKVDRLDAGLRTFVDREDQIDAVVGLLDDFRRHADVVATRTAIDLGDALGVGLHHRTRKRTAGLRLHFGIELVVLDLLVALEGNATDHRVFDHADDQTATGLIDLHVLEKARLDQRLEAVIDGALVQTAARPRTEIGADGFDIDAAIAFNGNRSSSLRHRDRRKERRSHRSGNRHGNHDRSSKQTAPETPQSKNHAPSALIIPVPPARTPTDRQNPLSCPACSQFCPTGKRPFAVVF